MKQTPSGQNIIGNMTQSMIQKLIVGSVDDDVENNTIDRMIVKGLLKHARPHSQSAVNRYATGYVDANDPVDYLITSVRYWVHDYTKAFMHGNKHPTKFISYSMAANNPIFADLVEKSTFFTSQSAEATRDRDDLIKAINALPENEKKRYEGTILPKKLSEDDVTKGEVTDNLLKNNCKALSIGRDAGSRRALADSLGPKLGLNPDVLYSAFKRVADRSMLTNRDLRATVSNVDEWWNPFGDPVQKLTGDSYSFTTGGENNGPFAQDAGNSMTGAGRGGYHGTPLAHVYWTSARYANSGGSGSQSVKTWLSNIQKMYSNRENIANVHLIAFSYDLGSYVYQLAGTNCSHGE